MPTFVMPFFNIFLPISQILLILYGIYLLYNDYLLNKTKSVIYLPFFKWILIYTLYLLILNIYQRTFFATFNNAFFIIHSVLFFLVLLIYYDNYSCIESIAKISLLFVSFISFFSIVTLVIFLITNSGIINYIDNKSIKDYLIYVAPPGKRIWGMLTNPNTFSYLIIYSNYIYLFFLMYFKKTKLIKLFILLISINFINLILLGSRGAILIFVISLVIFCALFLKLLKNNNNICYKLFKILFISFFALIILFVLYICLSDSKTALFLKDFFIKNLLRLKWLKSGSGRTMIWDVALNLDKKIYIFGISDNSIYPIYVDLLPKFAEKFLNNCGRYHNIYITLFVNYGIFALLGFLYFLFYSIIKFIKGYLISSFNKKIITLLFGAQFIVFIISGIFEQLALFSMSPHSLLFMLTWATLYGLSYSDNTNFGDLTLPIYNKHNKN